jgi:WD40 repeat protein
MLMNVRGSDSPLSSAVFSSNGRNIITAGDDNKVRVWRTAKADPTMFIPIDRALLQNLHQ